MEDLLIHTSHIKTDILIPNKIPGGCICFSLNQFISYFGEYIYIFKRKTLEKDFYIEIIPSGGVELYFRGFKAGLDKEYRYRSEDLGQEFRIYSSIDVQRYGIGIMTNFNHMKGVLEEKAMDMVIKEEIDFLNGTRKRIK